MTHTLAANRAARDAFLSSVAAAEIFPNLSCRFFNFSASIAMSVPSSFAFYNKDELLIKNYGS